METSWSTLQLKKPQESVGCNDAFKSLETFLNYSEFLIW